MKYNRKVGRRSFLARVAGGGALLGGAFGLVAPRGAAAQVTDGDPGDPIGRGRGGGTGITDSDTGAGADPAGRGRGGGPRPGQTGFSDRDSGANADPAGQGRGTEFGGTGNQYEQQARVCNDLDLTIRNLRTEISNAENRARRLETTANYIASDYAATPYDQRGPGNPRMSDYVGRAYQLGLSVGHNNDPQYIVQELNRMAAESRREQQQAELELANTRNLLAQYNCMER